MEQTTIHADGMSEVEETQIKRTRRILFVFPVSYWFTVGSNHIGDDVYIKTNKQIRNVYLNGKLLRLVDES